MSTEKLYSCKFFIQPGKSMKASQSWTDWIQWKGYSASFFCLGNAFFQILLSTLLKSLIYRNWVYKNIQNILFLNPKTALGSCHDFLTFNWKCWFFPCLSLPLKYFNFVPLLFKLVKCLFEAIHGMKDTIEFNSLYYCLIVLWTDNIIDTKDWTKKKSWELKICGHWNISRIEYFPFSV